MLTFLIPLNSQVSTSEVSWFDPREAPFELSGFEWIKEEGVYRRLPVHPDCYRIYTIEPPGLIPLGMGSGFLDGVINTLEDGGADIHLIQQLIVAGEMDPVAEEHIRDFVFRVCPDKGSRKPRVSKT